MDDSIIKRNAAVIAELKTNSMRRRLTKELEKMYPLYDQIEVEFNPEGKIQITVLDFNKENLLQNYRFVLTNDYPFRTPAIFFQSKPYIDFLKIRTRLPNINFKKMTGYDCFCCHSLNCSDNWTPAFTLNHIIDEIRLIKTQKRNIIYKIFADIVKRRFLIDDIDLDSWLF